MTQAMLPPPLPTLPLPGMSAMPAPVAMPAPIPVAAPAAGGYPVPSAAVPPAAVQGYPGPAVGAPAPVPVAPQPMAQPVPVYAQPAQPQPVYAPAPAAPVPVYSQPAPAGYPQPAPVGYAQPAPAGYPAPAPGYPPQAAAPIGDIGAAIANATGGDRRPQLQPGFTFVVEVISTIVTVHPVEKKMTFIADLKILQSNCPSQPAGAEASYVDNLAYGGSRIRDFLIAGVGFPSKTALEEAYRGAGHDPEAALKALANAAANPQTTPVKGKRLNVTTWMSRKTPKTGKNAGKETDYLTHNWAPAAAA